MTQELSPNSIVARSIPNFSQVHSLPAESVVELVVYLSHLNSLQEYKRQSSREIIQPCQKKDDGLLQHKNSIGATAHRDCTQVNSSSVESNTTSVENTTTIGVEATSLETLGTLTLIVD